MLGILLSLLLQADSIRSEALEAHVRFLASDAMKGRNNDTPEGLRASAYVADRFREAGLTPAGKDGYYHEFTARAGKGRNVAGLLEGENPKEVVVVGAHHDGLGLRKGVVHNGADDNASGVAVVIELARAFSARGTGGKPRRSILFVSFDCEEDGLLGSKAFVASGLHDPSTFAAMFVFDLIGGNFFEWERKTVYALGSEYSRELFDRVGRLGAREKDLEVVRSGVFLLEPVVGLARSDYQAFRARKVPFVFFSTGTGWTYHTRHDDVERLNLAKMTHAARFAYRVIEETASDEARPEFRQPGVHPENIGHLKALFGRVLENRARLKIDEKKLAEVRAMYDELSAMKEPNAARLQRAMIVLFSVARSQGEK